MSDLAVPLIKDVLPKLGNKATCSALDQFEKNNLDKEQEEQQEDSLYSSQIKIQMILLK